MKKTLLSILVAFALCFNMAMAENYAVLISPGLTTSDNTTNNSEYWYDLYLAYEMLRNKGFTHNNIYVCYGNGDSYTSSVWRYKLLRHLWTDIVDMSNSKSDIEDVFDYLSSTCTSSDKLIVYWILGEGTNSYGGAASYDNFAAYIKNQDEFITENEIITMINSVTTDKKIIFWNCDHSGCLVKGNNILSNADNFVLTGCDWDEDTYYITKDYSHSRFSYYNTGCLYGSAPGSGGTEYFDADYNNDGYISMWELWAEVHLLVDDIVYQFVQVDGMEDYSTYTHLTGLTPMSTSGTLTNWEVWHDTNTLTGDVVLDGGGTYIIISKGMTLNLGSYSITSNGGSIYIEDEGGENEATINPYISLKNPIGYLYDIFGLYSDFSDAISDAGSGDIITVNSNIVLTQNESLPANVTLVINSGYVDLNGHTLTIGSGAEVVSNIRVKNGTSIEGYYALISDAMTRCATGEIVEVEGTHTIDDYYFEIPSGKTLKCLSGTELILRNEYWYLRNLGTLIADNTTFRTTSGTWGGVFYAGSTSSGSLTNCEIYDAVLGVYCLNSNPTIDNCEIYDCMVKGIALTNADPTIEDCSIHDCEYGIWCVSGSEPTISACSLEVNEYGVYCDESDPTIEDCYINGDESAYSYGIYCYDSDPEIEDNVIRANCGFHLTNGSSPQIRNNTIDRSVTDKGMYCYSNSSPILADVLNGHGYNSFSGNFVSIAVHAVNSSYPVLGFTSCGSEDYGYNTFDYDYVDDFLVRAENCTTISAEHCYWGGTPSPSLFYGSVDYIPYLNNDPNNSPLLPTPESDLYNQRFMLASSVVNANEEISEDLTQYYNEQWDLETKIGFLRYLTSLGEAKGVADRCKDIISENPNAPEAFIALDMIYQISKNNKIKKDIDEKMFKTYLKTFNGKKSNKYLEANAMLLLANLEKDVKHMDRIYKEYKDTYMGKHALYHQFLYYVHVEDFDLAQEILNEMDKVYPNEELTLDAHRRMGDNIIENKIEQIQVVSTDIVNIIPKEYILKAAYPNPFNPTTTLEYQLPIQSEITCSIYNISGNLIKEYTNNQNAGIHSIIWDGSNVSSGIYLIRFMAKASDGSEKFVDYQKVTLLK